jgi:hypothetical protein
MKAQHLFPRIKQHPTLPTVSVPKEIRRIDFLKFCTLTDLTDGTKEKTCGELTSYHFEEKRNNEMLRWSK